MKRLLGLALGLVLVAFARHRYFVVVVRGRSMEPAYPAGTRLLAVRSRAVRTGDVVVFRPPAPHGIGQPMVKRVHRLAGPDLLVVRGDAPNSVDSGVFGPIPRRSVIGRIRRTPKIHSKS